MMSEQAKILAQMQELVMNILKTGSVSEEEGKKIDRLEDLLHEQKCFQEIDNSEYDYLGEEIVSLFLTNKNAQAIEKLIISDITPEDFFGFAEYHYEEEEEIAMFTDAFIAEVTKAYLVKNKS